MKNGFTLVELILVVAIFIALGSFSAIFFSNFLNQNNVTSVQDQLFSALRKAHTYSLVSRLSSTSGWGVHYDSTNKKIIVFQGPTYAGRNAALDENFSFSGPVVINGFTDILFSRVTGIPTPAGPLTITISSTNGISKQIILNEQGVASRILSASTTPTSVPPSSTPTPTPNPSGLITNGSFEATGASWLSPWNYGIKTGAAASVVQDSTTHTDGLYSARIDVTQSNATIWDIQLFQNTSITANILHTVSFSAKASTPLMVNVVVQQNYGSYTEYASQNFNLTTSWQTYTMSFTPSVTDTQVMLVFNEANTVGSIWYDNVKFTNSVITATPTPTPANMPAPVGYSTLVFDDLFPGTTLDSTKWVPQMADPGGIWCNSTIPCPNSFVSYPAGGYNAEYGNPNQVVINNGATLNAVKDTTYSGYTWKAGYITTYNKFTFSQGYVQVKAKMPDSSTGAWAGIWFLQSGGANEIDLQESGTLCSNSNVNYCMASNLHTTGNTQAKINTGVDLSAGYHIYGLDYKPGVSITMYLDGNQVAQFTSNVPTGAYDIIITETMAQNATGWHTNVSSSTPSPLSPYNISEVQVWR